MKLHWLVFLVALGCRDEQRTRATTAPVAPTPARAADAGVSALVAQTLCDWYWRSSSTIARPYDSFEACIAAETGERDCTEAQARACLAFARDARPGTGTGLHGSADCKACLVRTDDTLQKAFAEQQKALEHASLVVHSAVVERGWRKELAHEKDAAKVVINLDIELSGYGYRIDPDDFVIIDETKTGDAAFVGSDPHAERLTRTGAPIDWRDPSVIDDPDLRVRAFFAIPKSVLGNGLVVSYEGKRSAPLEITR